MSIYYLLGRIISLSVRKMESLSHAWPLSAAIRLVHALTAASVGLAIKSGFKIANVRLKRPFRHILRSLHS